MAATMLTSHGYYIMTLLYEVQKHNIPKENSEQLHSHGLYNYMAYGDYMWI